MADAVDSQILSTYGGSGLQVFGVDGVLVEAVPLLESVLGVLVLFLRVPVEHRHVELDPDGRAVLPEHTFRVVEQVVGVQDADFDAAWLRDRAVVGLAADLGSDNAGLLEVVEGATQLVVTGFFRHEVVEAGLLDERRHAAAVIAGNGVARVADKEREVELLQQLLGHDSRVVRLGWSGVREGRAVGTAVWHHDAGVLVISFRALAVRIDTLVIGADAALGDAQRRSDACCLLVRWHEIVRDVFDENTLALRFDR